MSGILLQPKIIYGPIFSRRLGRSLGINLLPVKMKTCSFDCLYCQYNQTTDWTLSPDRDTLPAPDEVFEAVEKALKKPRSMDFLTFSGNGEPTIHPDFPEIVKGVRRLLDQYRPDAKLALLSNSTMVSSPVVQEALRLIDAPMMKLDGGDEATFQAINRPVEGLHLQGIIEGLRQIPHLMIQSVLVDGEVSNVRGEAYQAWKAALVDLQPHTIHIYSTERPTMSGDVVRVGPERLLEIEEELTGKLKLNAQAFWRE
ncbi:MAG: radical SAM protein [Anaerolineaceae bacterium]|nr:radical SAM protein [Anaerolineaceae bacterium]